jgi:AcrR family transcriptional regulator
LKFTFIAGLTGIGYYSQVCYPLKFKEVPFLSPPNALKFSASGRHHQAILAEAGKCLLEHGLQKTTIHTIANRLGLSRQTIYRNFENRDDLLSALYMNEFYKHMPKIKDAINNQNFEDSILLATLRTINATHQNEIMMEMAYGSGIQWFQDQNLSRNSPLYKRIMLAGETLWSDMLNAARDNGTLNPQLSNREVFEWLMNIHYLMIAHKDMTRKEHTAMIKKLLIPSLTK